jgi:hypothetical protein
MGIFLSNSLFLFIKMTPVFHVPTSQRHHQLIKCLRVRRLVGVERNSGKRHTRDILTEIYRLSGMKSFRDDLIDRMETGWGRFVLASVFTTTRVFSTASDDSTFVCM